MGGVSGQWAALTAGDGRWSVGTAEGAFGRQMPPETRETFASSRGLQDFTATQETERRASSALDGAKGERGR